MTDREFATFEQFWPYYVAMHSRRSTRWIHVVGTLSGLALTVAALATATWVLLPALPVLGYGAAWPSHWFIERNNPASFGHPAWSLRGDFRMIIAMLRGNSRSLDAVAYEWLARHPADRSPGSLRLAADAHQS